MAWRGVARRKARDVFAGCFFCFCWARWSALCVDRTKGFVVCGWWFLLLRAWIVGRTSPAVCTSWTWLNLRFGKCFWRIARANKAHFSFPW
ncbi:hypothetical protein BKA61DRAFT_8253 [Leptodontidium sp. MPI-SDFR-AT-0119]|nr:hypothetical protein BKA61DRAFT_8253 [Leptodontidium sp. MPI-SDFR-AT-0119]